MAFSGRSACTIPMTVSQRHVPLTAGATLSAVKLAPHANNRQTQTYSIVSNYITCAMPAHSKSVDAGTATCRAGHYAPATASVGTARESPAARRGIEITPLHPKFGVQVKGLDLTKPLTDDDARALLEVWRQHDLLLFRRVVSARQRSRALWPGSCYRIPHSASLIQGSDGGPPLQGPGAHPRRRGAPGALLPARRGGDR